LQEKQFLLIRCLATAAGTCVPYERIYRDVWGDTIVEHNQMHFQKRRLIERIQNVEPDIAKTIKTVPKRGFMLDIAPDSALVIPLAYTAGAA